MKKSRKRLLLSFGIAAAAICLTGCTKSFCSVEDKAELINTYAKNNLETINETAESRGILIPQEDFLAFIETKVTEYMALEECPVDSNGEKLESFARYAGYNENGEPTLFYNFDIWVEEAKNSPTIGVENTPGRSYISLYKTELNNGANSTTACITPTSGFFGLEGNERYVTGKTWGEAFADYGPLEGLFVYPIACMLHYFSLAFGTTGGGQVGAILLVTIIIRLIILLITFPATLSQTKMTELQPKIAELQQKYPSQTQSDKQRVAAEQMKLYKENHVHPFLQMLLMVPQFIIFICVWSALQGSAILTQGTVFGLQLTTITYQAILSGSGETPFAIILFLLMTIAQICSTLTPQWISKWKEKNLVTRLVKVEQNQQQKTMKYVSYFMLVFIVFMGLTLPAAMGIYWLVGALFTIFQTVLLEIYQRHKRHKRGNKSSGGTSWNRNKNKKKESRFSVRRG